MMEENKSIHISHPDYNIPELTADESQGIFSIKGESYPEDCQKFYAPFSEKIIKFIENSEIEVIIEIKLTYYNTATSKVLINLFNKIYKYSSQGKKATVRWYCDKNDSEIIQDAEDFELITGLEIEIITF